MASSAGALHPDPSRLGFRPSSSAPPRGSAPSQLPSCTMPAPPFPILPRLQAHGARWSSQLRCTTSLPPCIRYPIITPWGYDSSPLWPYRMRSLQPSHALPGPILCPSIPSPDYIPTLQRVRVICIEAPVARLGPHPLPLAGARPALGPFRKIPQTQTKSLPGVPTMPRPIPPRPRHSLYTTRAREVWWPRCNCKAHGASEMGDGVETVGALSLTELQNRLGLSSVPDARAFNPGRRGSGDVALGARAELTLEDLAELEVAGVALPKARLKQVRDSHHLIAQMLAQGAKQVEVAAATGFSVHRIYELRMDPAFQELLEYYRAERKQVWVDTQARLSMLGNDAIAEIHQRLVETPEAIKVSDVLEIAKFATDRTGHGPQTKVQATHVHVGADTIADLKRAAQEGALGHVHRDSIPGGEAVIHSGGSEDLRASVGTGVRGVAPDSAEADEAQGISGGGDQVSEESGQTPGPVGDGGEAAPNTPRGAVVSLRG